ncbi:MAG: trehalose-phosphatase, partial [Nitrospirales bacterium]|nr:trehalose-phosphatase [Nitrospirales bacterium]
VRVDGIEIARMGLHGKPDPDMFLEAAKRLRVKPERAIVLEDAESGVKAGRKGGFGLVIGVNRSHQEGALRAHGADWEVSDFRTVTVESKAKSEGADVSPENLSALEHMEELAQKFEGNRLAFFLDYDGTLTPIVDQPEAAILSDDMRETIDRLARYSPVAIVSGRDRADVRKLVQLDTVVYAGSHGFDIAGPNNLHLEHEEGRKSQPALRAAGDELHQRLRDIAGIRIERKAFAVAVHFRLVEDSSVPDIKQMVENVAGQYPDLRITGGKKIFELRPDIDWDKGKAVLWLLEALQLDNKTLPIYIGDDETDEDAFTALQERGIGILVSHDPKETEAQYSLRDLDEVQKFLSLLIENVQGRKM